MKNFVLIGRPVAHSVSPALFQRWFSESGIEAGYRAVEVSPRGLGSVLESLRNGTIAGANVTIPCKQAAARHCDQLDEAARKTGAVNTLAADESGKLTGLNTDAPGFLAALAERAEGWPRHAPACVLGSGGAARAVVYALGRAGAGEIRIVARNRKAAAAAAAVCRRPRPRVFGWSEASAALEGAGLLVNATPLGMKGFPPLEIPVPKAVPGAVAFDLVYNPAHGAFLARCRARGYAILNGTGMLVNQAALAYRAWLGETPPVTPELAGWLENVILGREQEP